MFICVTSAHGFGANGFIDFSTNLMKSWSWRKIKYFNTHCICNDISVHSAYTDSNKCVHRFRRPAGNFQCKSNCIVVVQRGSAPNSRLVQLRGNEKLNMLWKESNWHYASYCCEPSFGVTWTAFENLVDNCSYAPWEIRLTQSWVNPKFLCAKN